jgi:hypothetical protein
MGTNFGTGDKLWHKSIIEGTKVGWGTNFGRNWIKNG